MYPWSDAQRQIEYEASSYAMGDAIFSGSCRGTVTYVDTNVISVEWDDGKDRYGAITYPIEATCLRKGMPWE